MTIETAVLETPIGRIVIAWENDVVLAVEMGAARDRTRWDSKDVAGDLVKRMRKRLLERFPGAEIVEGARGAAVPRALHRYFEGDVAAIDALRVNPGGEGFHARVWKALRRIPAGETWTYGQVASAAGSASARAAGGAVGANPIAIVVPCHRVVGASGDLTGFGGGLVRKAWLLRHEGAIAAEEPARQLELPVRGSGDSAGAPRAGRPRPRYREARPRGASMKS